MAMGIGKRELGIVVVLLTGVVLAVLNMTFLSPALPTIMADMGVAQTTVQWLTSGYALTEAVVIPLSAYLIGRFSTRQLYIGGISLFTAGSLLAAVAPSFPFLLAGRIMQAACTGAIMPMVFTVILLIFPREKRGSAMGVIGLVIGFAPVIGPSLSGILVDSLGWRFLFVIVTVLSVCVLLSAIFFLKNYGDFSRTKLDIPSVVFSTVGLLCLLYGLSSVTSSQNKLVNVALMVFGIAVLVVYVLRQLKLEQPMINVSILKTRRYATAVIVIVIIQASLVGSEVVMPLYVQGVHGYPATYSGLIMLPGALIGAAVGFFAGRLFDRFGVRKLVVPGALLLLCGAICVATLEIDTDAVFICIRFTVLIIGLQFLMTPLNTWGINSLDNKNIQHAQGVGNTLNQVAGSFGTALLVTASALGPVVAPQAAGVEQSFAGIHLSFCTMACLLTVGVVVILVFVRNRKTEEGSANVMDTPDVTALTLQEGFGTQVFSHVGSVTGMYAPALHQLTDLTSLWTVSDVMNRDPHYISAAAPMSEVVRLMAGTDTSGIPVVDNELSLVGFISDGDVAKYLGHSDITVFNPNLAMYRMLDDEETVERMQGLFALDVMDIATKRVVSVEAGSRLDDAIRTLSARRIKKVPVVKNGRLVGTLSRRNIMHALSLAISEA